MSCAASCVRACVRTASIGAGSRVLDRGEAEATGGGACDGVMRGGSERAFASVRMHRPWARKRVREGQLTRGVEVLESGWASPTQDDHAALQRDWRWREQDMGGRAENWGAMRRGSAAGGGAGWGLEAGWGGTRTSNTSG
eukprot:6205924-Pleurochrysis_carterae.AAC.3